jgi:hypothetical protein
MTRCTMKVNAAVAHNTTFVSIIFVDTPAITTAEASCAKSVHLCQNLS